MLQSNHSSLSRNSLLPAQLLPSLSHMHYFQWLMDFIGSPKSLANSVGEGPGTFLHIKAENGIPS